MPPLPAHVMMCAMAKLVTLMSERVPVGVPRNVAPSASHESSTTSSPWSSASRRTASQSGALPIRFGRKIAFVRGPTSSSILDTSALNVSGSTSTKTGTRPRW